MRKLCAVVVAVGVLAGCSSGSKPEPKFTPKPGVAAVDLARHVKGCTGAKATDPASGATSAASCTLEGHEVDFYGWATAGRHPLSSLNAVGGESAYAWGPGWSAILGEPGDFGTFFSAARLVADSLGGETAS